jgi:hypothetical protein
MDDIPRFWISKYGTDEEISPVTEFKDSVALAVGPTTGHSHGSFQSDEHPQNKFPKGISLVYLFY